MGQNTKPEFTPKSSIRDNKNNFRNYYPRKKVKEPFPDLGKLFTKNLQKLKVCNGVKRREGRFALQFFLPCLFEKKVSCLDKRTTYC